MSSWLMTLELTSLPLNRSGLRLDRKMHSPYGRLELIPEVKNELIVNCLLLAL